MKNSDTAKPSMKVKEGDILNAIFNWMQDADGDEMARVTGEMFGGECFTDDGDIYTFTPNENYTGVFDKSKGE